MCHELGRLLPPQTVLQGVCKAATWASSLDTVALAPILRESAQGTSPQHWVHIPAQLCSPKLGPQHSCPTTSATLQGRQHCGISCLITKGIFTPLQKSSSVLALLYPASSTLLQLDLPALHTRWFLGLRWPMLSIYNLNLPLTMYCIFQETNHDKLSELQIYHCVFGRFRTREQKKSTQDTNIVGSFLQVVEAAGLCKKGLEE